MKVFVVLALCVAAVTASTPTLARFRMANTGIRPRIIGGTEAVPGSWPWQVSLGFFGFHNCGGILIDANWVLTAAHCTSGVDEVYLGYHDSSSTNTQSVYIAEYKPHPGFANDGSQGFPNDIAVLRLEEPADLSNPNIAVATLPSDDSNDYTGLECIITGWGIPDDDFFPSDVLLQADVDVLTQEECQAGWPNTPISRMHICVFDKENQRTGACNGDSGGPLNCKVDGSWVVAGVTSWGVAGCEPTYPSVYARVSFFREWIRENSGI